MTDIALDTPKYSAAQSKKYRKLDAKISHASLNSDKYDEEFWANRWCGIVDQLADLVEQGVWP
jgi:hypothetical protein